MIILILTSLLNSYTTLPYKDSPTPKLAAKRSANLLQIQFTLDFTLD